MEAGREKIVRLALIVCLVLIVSLCGVVISLTTISVAVPNSGTIISTGVGVYWNLACTNRTVSMNWGTINASSYKKLTLYLRNEGNVAATFTKTTQNWVPATAASCMRLTWNYTNQLVGINEVVPVTLWLTTFSNASAITSFSFETVIAASG